MNLPGKHRKRVKHYDEPGDAHLMTFSCYNRLQLLSKNRTRWWFIEALEEASWAGVEPGRHRRGEPNRHTGVKPFFGAASDLRTYPMRRAPELRACLLRSAARLSS